MDVCPCGTGKSYMQCCGVYIDGGIHAPDPESLMRSRYTAYSRVNIDYIMRTMRSYAAEGFDAVDAFKWASQAIWGKLDVRHATIDGHQGFVEFIATYALDQQDQSIHEISEFSFEDGQWFYIDGIMLHDGK